MNVLILTQELGNNIGGILQNWALQQILFHKGHYPITLIRRPIPKLKKLYYDINEYAYFYAKKFLHHPTRNIEIRTNKLNSRYDCLKKFIKKHIIHTEPIYKIDSDFLRKYKIRHCLVGSDQVWRPKYNINSFEYMFCSFIKSESDIKCSTYAASFGVDNWELTQEQTSMALANIPKFSIISVRERSGISLCDTYLHTKAHHVLDPTLLLDAASYHTLVSNADYKDLPQEKFAAIYMLDSDSTKKSAVNSFCKERGMLPLSLNPHNEDSTSIENVFRPSIEKWLAAFTKASYIITDSFHGAAFAINFNKPFICICNKERGNARFSSLADQFGLQGKFIENADIDKMNVVDKKKINWDEINKIKSQLRIFSINILDYALS